MANRIRTTLTGFAGGPGVATFYSTDLAAMRAALTDFWGNVCTKMPSGFVATIDTEGDIVDSATGLVTGTWTAPAITPSGSGGSGNYAGPVGATITWLTGVVADGSRVRGRTFLVPLPVEAYDGAGTLLETTRTVLQSAAASLVTAASPGFVVWHRPRLERPATGTLPRLPAHAGLNCIVNGSIVPDRAQILRSRRQ